MLCAIWLADWFLVPLEEHVLEDMGQSGAQVLVLVDAAGRAPCLYARHWRAMIFLNDDGEAVRQNPFLRCARRKRDSRRRFRCDGL